MAAQNHIIKKQILDLTLASDTGSLALQSRICEIFKSEILPLLDTYCTKIGGGPDVFRINRLEVDLGVLDERNLATDFKRKIHEIFPERLTMALDVGAGGCRFQGDTRERTPFRRGFRDRADRQGESHRPPEQRYESTLVASGFYDRGRTAEERVITKKSRDFELLQFFIKEGRLPWWVKNGETPVMAEVLAEMVAGERRKMKAFLMEIAEEPAPVQRIAYMATGTTLEKLIALFHPRQAKEVYNLSCQFIQTLRDCPLFSGISPARLAREIWAAVLTRSFICRGPGFDSHTVLEYLVRFLAGAFARDEKAIYRYLAKKGKGWLKKASRYRERVAEKREKETDTSGDMGIDTESRTGKPRQKRIADRTGAYLQQLETLIRLGEELVLVLPAKKKLLGVPVTEELIDLLRKTGKAIPGIKEVIINLLKRTAKPDIFLVTPAEMDAEEKRKAEEFTELSERLYHALAAVLEKKPPGTAVEDEVFGKAEKILATIDEIKRTVQASAKPAKTGTAESGAFTDTEEIYLANAGLVLLWPYLPVFFTATGLVVRPQEKEGVPEFLNEEARERAVLLLHYLVFGAKKGQEYEMVLNKILCGLPPGRPVNPSLEQLTKKELREAENFLQAVINNWPVMKNASVPALRAMFLQREGVLFTRDGWRVLRVAEKTHDVLLDRLPWGIGTVKLPWMEELLLVEWRR